MREAELTLHGTPRLAPGLIERPRLFARLESEAALVVLHAPAGYGKTTALAQWAARTERTGVWLRVREGVSGEKAFIEALASELDAAGLLQLGNPLLQAAQILPSSSDPWELLLRGLRRVGGPLSLVVDEAELLSSPVATGLLQLLVDLPTLSLRLATRTPSRFTEPGLALTIHAEVITVDELALTPGEGEQILGEDAAPDLQAQLADHGSAPAVARMIALGASDGGRSIDDVVESLLRLRSPRWDERFAAFLSRISLSDFIDERIAAELTGRVDARELLDRAESEGLGAWLSSSDDGEPPLFEVSPVFRRHFAARISQQLGPEELHDLQSQISRWHAEHGRAYPAMSAAVAAKDWEFANEIALQFHVELLIVGTPLTELFREVPILSLRGYPFLAILLAIRSNASGGNRLRALEYFGIAVYGARRRLPRAVGADRVVLRAIESAALRVTGRFDAALVAAEDGYAALAAIDIEDQQRIAKVLAIVCEHLGLTLLYGGRYEQAVDCFRRAFNSGGAHATRSGLAGLAHEAGLLAIIGELPEAKQTIELAEQQNAIEGWREQYLGVLYQLARAMLAVEEGDLDEADERIGVLARHRATTEHWSLIEHVDATISLLRGEPRAGLLRLEQAIRHQQGRRAAPPTTLERLAPTQVQLRLALGDFEAAERMIEGMHEGARKGNATARLALARGNARAALKELDRHRDEPLPPRTHAERLALRAAATALTGAPEAHQTFDELRYFLLGRRLALPLLLVPMPGIEVLLGIAEPGDPLAPLLQRARTFAAIDGSTARPVLTPREQVVASHLGRGDSVAAIANTLVVSPNTVKSQLRSLYRKLGVNSRAEAVTVLAGWGLLDA